MNAIVLEHVCKRFGDRVILNDVSAVMEQGKIYGIVGDNGCGKSVLLKCVCGILETDGGKILVENVPVQPGKSGQPPIGMIIEHTGFLEGMSGWHNLKYLAGIRGMITDEQIRESVDYVGLTDAIRKKVKKYSLGMRQKLAIAQAVMENPNVLIMDEPFNALDRKSREKIGDLFRILRDHGKTIVLVSHHQDEIQFLCDTVFEMSTGNLNPMEDLNVFTKKE